MDMRIDSRSTDPGRGLPFVGFAASAVLALGLFFTPVAYAGDVQLAVGLSLNDEKLGDHQAVTPEGKSAEIRLDGKMRLFVNPLVTRDGSILLSMRVEEPSGSRWVEIGEPKVMTQNGNQAEIKVTSPKGNVYRITVRPNRL
jgi:hypothetical protein